jgi:hypothetical protein
MHVFEIDPLETTIQIWQEIEMQTKTMLEIQHKENGTLSEYSGASTQTGEEHKNVEPALLADITAQSSGSQHIGQRPVAEMESQPSQSTIKTASRTQDLSEAFRQRYFKSTNPPDFLLEQPSTQDSLQTNVLPDSDSFKVGPESQVLTEAGRRHAQEIGLKLKASRPFLAEADSGASSQFNNNRWASYKQDHLASKASEASMIAEGTNVLTRRTNVLTPLARSQAEQIGQELKANRTALGLPSSDHYVGEVKTDANRWASYSTSLQSALAGSEKPTAGFSTPKLQTTVHDSSSLGHKRYDPAQAALESSFYENFQSQLAKLSIPTVFVNMSENNELGNATKSPPVKNNDTEDEIFISTNCVRDNCEECLSATLSDVEETNPLLPIGVEDKATEPSYTLLADENPVAIPRSLDDADLVKEFVRRGVLPATATYEDLLARLGNGRETVDDANAKDPSKPLSDPVEVTVGKMLMQMVSSVISNLNTLNSQIQGEAKAQVPHEVLRLRGYPDSAHADDLWHDMETLKDVFEEFDIATADIMRTFERMHDHDEFPAGSGMLRLHGLSNTRGPLPQIATALQNLVTGIQKTCIPAVGENGRLQYRIPRRLATAGYEDTWALIIHRNTHKAVASSVKDSVERILAKHGYDLTTPNIRLSGTDHHACLMIEGKTNAENALDVLSEFVGNGQLTNVSMKRELYPPVFSTRNGRRPIAQNNQDIGLNVSPSEMSQTLSADQANTRNAKQDADEKRKAIQDRRAAWRREYKARTQTVRVGEAPLSPPRTEANRDSQDPSLPSRPYSVAGPINPLPARLSGRFNNTSAALHRRRSMILFTRTRSRSPEATEQRPVSHVADPTSVKAQNITFAAPARGDVASYHERPMEVINAGPEACVERRDPQDINHTHIPSSEKDTVRHTAPKAEPKPVKITPHCKSFTSRAMDGDFLIQPRFPPLPSMSMEPLIPSSPIKPSSMPELETTVPGDPVDTAARSQQLPSSSSISTARTQPLTTQGSKKIYVGNLPISVGETWISLRFEKFGQLRDVALAKDASTGKSKG